MRNATINLARAAVTEIDRILLRQVVLIIFSHRIASRQWLASTAVISLIIVALAWPMHSNGQTREEAVALAREGETEKAIAALRRMLGESPSDKRVAFDLAVILTWVGRPREATDAFERAGAAEPPQYVLGPIIRAYRDQKRFKEAERWAYEAAKRYPLDPTWIKLRGLVLADQGKTKESIALLQPWAGVYPSDAEMWLALGYASQRSGDRFATLRNYGHALRLQPENREAAEAMAGALSEMGAPFGAATLLPEAPMSLRVRQAALLARWGETMTPRDSRRRFEGTDAALARLDKLLKEARAARKPDRDLILRLRRDQVVALRNRERWADTVAAAARLRADGDHLPLYVEEAEADALLALRSPTRARDGYEKVLRVDPGNRNARIGRFFALVEEENFAEAFREIDRLAAEEKPGLKLPNQRVTYANDQWLEGKVLAGRARSFADMQAAAWKRISPLVEAAPANAELRSLLGDLAAARGWPRLGDEEIHIAASLAPDDKDVQIALAETAMRRRRWDEARERARALLSLYPADAAVARTQLELRMHDAFELRTEVSHRHEKGGATASGGAPGSGTEMRAWLFTPPVGEVWRFIGAWEWADAKVTEGLARRYREGAGVELALPDLTIELMGWNNDGAIAQPGADAAVTWQPSDHWTFGVDAAYFAADTPLRAVLNQITANSAGATVEYAWNESRSARLRASWYDFSDGNRRRSASLTFNQKIVDVPHLDVTLRPELYASENSSDQGPYFSPLRDLSAAITLDAKQDVWRHYERSFGHQLALTAGGYWQENFGSDWIGSVRYEHIYQHNPRVELRYGAQYNRSVYDGDLTPSIEAFVRLNLRF
jgi:biofilm PGA synthesis protein PgaA